MLSFGQIKEKCTLWGYLCTLCVYLCYTLLYSYNALLSNKTNQCIQETVPRVPNPCRWGKYWIWGHMVWDWELIPPKSNWKTKGSPSLFKLNFYLKSWKIMLILTKLKVPKELKPLKRFCNYIKAFHRPVFHAYNLINFHLHGLK